MVITFTLSGVVDSGGQKRQPCDPGPIPAVTPTYEWSISRPGWAPVTGSGLVATVATVDMDLPGDYTCVFTATADRDCPPSPRVIQASAAASPVDLDVDSNNDGGITAVDELIEDITFSAGTPGKWLWLNNDDDDGDQVPDNADDWAGNADDLAEDLADLVVQPIPAGLAADPHLFLEIDDPSVVRVFRRRAEWANGILGPGKPTRKQVDIALGGWTFTMEGVAPGSTLIHLILEDGGNEVCRDAVRVTAGEIDLDGDADQNMIIDEADDPTEGQLPGAITLSNVDDDDEDGTKDGLGTQAGTLEGADDHLDLAPVVLRQVLCLPANSTVALTLYGAKNVGGGVAAEDVVRVFSALAPGPDVEVLLGPGTATFELPENASHNVDLAALKAGDISLAFEGLEFAGEVKLKVEVLDGTQTVRSTDTVQLKVAPLILLHHLLPAERSFVSRIMAGPLWTVEEDADSTAYCLMRFPGATPGAVTDTVILPDWNGGYDVWAQDEYQIGFQQAPYGSMYVMLDSKRDRGLNDFTNRPQAQGGLLGPDFGHIQLERVPAVGATSMDAFGNLEVSPPCADASGNYPFGRIYYGDDPGSSGLRRMDEALREFLVRQKVQDPGHFESDWLAVGHVDEFMSIVPDTSGTYGWKVLFADSALAVTILQGVDPDLHIPRYTDFNTNGYVVDTAEGLLQFPLKVPHASASTIVAFNGPGSPMDTLLTGLKSDVELAFGLTASDFIPVPVLFDRVHDYRWGVVEAITPDLANGAVYPGTYIAPDQFLHTYGPGALEEDFNGDFILNLGEDTNGNQKLDTFRDPFHIYLDGVLSQTQVDAVYIDNWMVYHLHAGEVHCSSNEQRALPTGIHWWD
ncbi:MAG: hypothetical protein GY842_12605 [bacterium]|nr:hypothetical protein [bacterium]